MGTCISVGPLMVCCIDFYIKKNSINSVLLRGMTQTNEQDPSIATIPLTIRIMGASGLVCTKQEILSNYIL